jgi:ribosomal protein S18 acetylase RimI-like enzyme
MEIRELKTKQEANAILEFFFSGKALTWKLSENQEESIRKRVDNALEKQTECRFWFFEDPQREIVVAAGLVERDGASNGGFIISWLGVHEEYRRKGLGRQIVSKIEEHVKAVQGKFITINTSPANKEANIFYQSLGYKIVSDIPNYYGEGYSKVTYYKKL